MEGELRYNETIDGYASWSKMGSSDYPHGECAHPA